MPNCSSGLEEMALHAFYYRERVRPFWNHAEEWTARISTKQLVLLDVGYVVDNIDFSHQGEKRVISRDPRCGENGDLGDAKQGIVWQCKSFSS